MTPLFVAGYVDTLFVVNVGTLFIMSALYSLQSTLALSLLWSILTPLFVVENISNLFVVEYFGTLFVVL